MAGRQYLYIVPFILLFDDLVIDVGNCDLQIVGGKYAAVVRRGLREVSALVDRDVRAAVQIVAEPYSP